MNLLVVSNFPSGRHALAAIYLRDTLREVAGLGHRITVLAPRVWVPWPLGYVSRYAAYLKEAYHEEQEGIPVYRPAHPRPPGRWFVAHEGRSMASCSQRLIRKLHRVRRFDAVLGYAVLPYGDCAVRIGGRLSIPTACVAIGSDLHVFARMSRRTNRLARRTLSGAALVLTNSEELNRVAVEMGAAPERTRTYYKGIDLRPYEAVPEPAHARQRLGLPNHGMIVTFTGRLMRSKGVFELLEAFKRTLATHADSHLLLIGEPIELRTLKERAAELEIADRVRCPGMVPRSHIPDYLAASDLYVLPSHHEGISNGLLEAMAAGRAVVTTPVGGLTEVVRDGINGRLVQPRDATALAAVMSELLADRQQAERLGRAARETVFSRFDTRRNAAELADLVRKMSAP